MAAHLPILIYLIAVLGFAAVSLLLPHVVAPRKPTKIKDMPYESGMDPVGDARKPFDIKFYLTAILFFKSFTFIANNTIMFTCCLFF